MKGLFILDAFCMISCGECMNNTNTPENKRRIP